MRINSYMDVPGTDLSPRPEIPVFCAQISTLLKTIFRNSSYHTCRPVVNQIIEERDFSFTFLSLEEMETLNRFKALKKQIEWVCGRYMIKRLARAVLSRGEAPILDAGLPLDRITLDYHEKGAPFIVSCPRIPITLSHSGDFTAAGMGLLPRIQLGVDIEAIAPMPDQAFMKTAFTQREIQAMAPTPEAVFRCWTLKEAFLKFIGMGFNESLHRVEILGEEIFHNGKKIPLEIHTHSIAPGYLLSLVFGTPEPS